MHVRGYICTWLLIASLSPVSMNDVYLYDGSPLIFIRRGKYYLQKMFHSFAVSSCVSLYTRNITLSDHSLFSSHSQSRMPSLSKPGFTTILYTFSEGIQIPPIVIVSSGLLCCLDQLYRQLNSLSEHKIFSRRYEVRLELYW